MLSRDNYEIWFMNYLDGQLSPEEVKTLGAFLSQNPDLQEELKGVERLLLQPEDISFKGKERLLKDEASLMGLEQSDYLLVKQLEEGLNVEEEKQLASLIRQDASLQKVADSYSKTILKAPEIHFSRKRALLHHPRTVLAFIRPLLSAAAIFLLFFAGWKWFNGEARFPRTDIRLSEISTLPGSALLPAIESHSLTRISKELAWSQAYKPLKDNDMIRHETAEESIQEASRTEVPMLALVSAQREPLILRVKVPNAYELGLSQMMPLYLDLQNQMHRAWAGIETPSSDRKSNNLLAQGLKIVDRVAPDLIQFNKIFDDDGNYVAYNIETPVFKMENLRAREKRNREIE